MGTVRNFLELFEHTKPVFGMLHLKGNGGAEILETAKAEAGILLDNGASAVIVENYFGSAEDVASVLQYLQNEKSGAVYGVNVLDNDALGFEYANKYGAAFIQLDSVAGHLTPEEDEGFNEQLAALRKNSSAFVLGGVRFKYQPYKSGRTLEQDLKIAMGRCDAVVVTGDGTGMNTPLDKISSFREILGDFPLIIGAGVTPENCKEQLSAADGAIVGSYFKDTYKDSGNVSAGHVRGLINEMKMFREK